MSYFNPNICICTYVQRYNTINKIFRNFKNFFQMNNITGDYWYHEWEFQGIPVWGILWMDSMKYLKRFYNLVFLCEVQYSTVQY